MPQLTSDLVSERSGTVTIASGQSISTAFDARGFSSFGVVVPAAISGSTWTFQVSHDGVTFQDLLQANGLTVSMVVAVNKSYSLPAQLASWRYFKINSGASQAADRTIPIMASSAAAVPGTADWVTINPGTGANNIGKSEDAAHTSGDVGVMLLGVANGGNVVALSGTEFDYTPMAVNTRGQILTAPMLNGSTDDGLSLAVGLMCTTAGSGHLLSVMSRLFNGTSYDRLRNNEVVTVLASAGRTATTNSSELVNYNGRGVSVQLLVTATTASPSLVLKIQTTDVTGGTMETVLTSATLTPSGTASYRFVVYPGAGQVANQVVSLPIGRFWRVSVEHGNTDSCTYSVRATVIV